MKKTFGILAVLTIALVASSAFAADNQWIQPHKVDLASVSHPASPEESSWILNRIASQNSFKVRALNAPLPAVPSSPKSPAMIVKHSRAEWLVTEDRNSGFSSVVVVTGTIPAKSTIVKKYVTKFGDMVTLDILSFDVDLNPGSTFDFLDMSAQGNQTVGVQQLVLYIFDTRAGILWQLSTNVADNLNSFLGVDAVSVGYDQYGMYLTIHGSFNPNMPAQVSIGGMLPGSDVKVGPDNTISVRPPNGSLYGPVLYDITVEQNANSYTYPWKYVPSNQKG